MRLAVILRVVLGLPVQAIAATHGPLFGLATPTNSQGEWSFDQGIFRRSTALGSQGSTKSTKVAPEPRLWTGHSSLYPSTDLSRSMVKSPPESGIEIGAGLNPGRWQRRAPDHRGQRERQSQMRREPVS
jgi:hypothetical protein